MDELTRLLEAIAALGDNPTPEAIAELLASEDYAEANLPEMLEAAQAHAAELAEGDLSDEVLAAMEDLAIAAEAIQARIDANEAEASERAERAAEIADRIRGTQASDEGDDDGEPAEGDTGDGEGTEDDGTGEDAEAPAPAPDEAEQEGVEQPEAVAASARRPRVGRVAARRPASMAPRPAAPALPEDIADWGLVASANAPNTPAGAPIRTRDALAQAFLSAFNATKGYRHGPRVKVNICQAGNENPAELYGEDRTLDSNLGANWRKIEQAAGQAVVASAGFDSITAAGGICAPSPVRYDLPVIGVDDRPVRDEMLVRFGADRGGVRVIPPPLIEDLEDAVGVWTAENDEDPDDPTVKPCLTLTCPDDDEAFVDAITRCLQIGNFRARYFPEQVEAWMRLAAVNHARRAETRLLTAIGTDSTQVNSGQVLGTVPDTLAAIDRASAIIRSTNRLGLFPLRWGIPFWLIDQMRADEARRIPGGTTDERYALAEANVRRWFSARNITITPFLDGEAGQVFPRQGDGPMIGWPTSVVTYLYPDGSHLFLDGGTLDLGLVRDSTLNSTNDLQMFAETFEGHIFHGVESWRLTLDTCPDGSISGTVDIDPCSTGS
jgi:hypothetical protein